MRKFILIAAMVLVSATAQAGASRSLTLAAGEEPVVAQQPKPTEAAKTVEATKPAETATPAETPKAEVAPAETPKFVERPSAVVTSTAAQPTKTDASKPVAAQTRTDKPKHRHYWTEARIIGELHRHGIYW